MISVACLYFVFQKVAQTPFVDFAHWVSGNILWVLILVTVLMAVNWALEALRWQLSVPEESLTFWNALQIILRGQALNWVLPFTSGDVGSRLISSKDPKSATVALMLNRMIILAITVGYGAVGVVSFFGVGSQLWGLLAVGAALVGSILWIAFKPNLLGTSISDFNFERLGRISLITLLRYGVFTFQFYIVISAFNPTLETTLIFLGIGWIFVFKSFIPAVLGNLGVREASAVLFFESYVPDIQLIIWPCTLIWLINIVIPSIIGAIPFNNFQRKLAA